APRAQQEHVGLLNVGSGVADFVHEVNVLQAAALHLVDEVTPVRVSSAENEQLELKPFAAEFSHGSNGFVLPLPDTNPADDYQPEGAGLVIRLVTRSVTAALWELRRRVNDQVTGGIIGSGKLLLDGTRNVDSLVGHLPYETLDELEGKQEA